MFSAHAFPLQSKSPQLRKQICAAEDAAATARQDGEDDAAERWPRAEGSVPGYWVQWANSHGKVLEWHGSHEQDSQEDVCA